MRDPRVDKTAEVLTHYSLALKPGDKLLIRGSEATAPLIRAVYREAVKIGAYPEVQVMLSGLNEIFLKEASDELLKVEPPFYSMATRTFDALLSIKGEVNLRSLSGVNPERQAIRSKASSKISQTFMQRSATGDLRWCVVQHPTPADAQEANMSLEDYEDFVYRACGVLEPDPVGFWRKMHQDQEQAVNKLAQFDVLRIVGADTDLSLRVSGRTWVNSSGEANFPDGEVFTGPVEESADGYIRFSFPGIYSGKLIEDIRLRFAQGRVVEAKAAQGQELLQALLATDTGASYLGEIGIGTNFGITKHTKNMLFDEKIGGTVHLALGGGYPETGSKNESAIHWDMLCDLRKDGEIYGDGQLIYKSGRFQF